MFIEVIDWRHNRIPKSYSDSTFYLERDGWNDFSFFTLYHLHLSGQYSDDGEPVLIGSTKILKIGQLKGDSYLINTEDLILGNESFCSLGQSLDYYERIAQLDPSLRDQILDVLRDVVIHPEYGNNFKDEEGWKTSLFRDINEKDDIFSIAPMLISRDFHKLPGLELKFEFNLPNLESPIVFDFDSPKYGYRKLSLPNRIAVFIGRNGSGKSTLLSKISRIAFASTKDRKDELLIKVGTINPNGLGFPKIVVLSYSAFDSFQVPGIYKQEKEQIAKDIRRGVGRYIFCGIRDICKELDEYLVNVQTDGEGKLLSSDIIEDRQQNTFLKSINDLAIEFNQLIQKIKGSEKITLLDDVLTILSEEPSLHEIRQVQIMELSDEVIINFFMQLSTGHKFVFHSIVNLVAHTDPRTLILFDEPETHLHPPILAILMKAIRRILNANNALMIVATHSPVILQETLKKHVFIMRREGKEIMVTQPDIQTFGENVGLITSAVFGLSSDITDYHTELDKVIRAISGDSEPQTILREIENLFGGELSMQARAYIMSRIYKIEN